MTKRTSNTELFDVLIDSVEKDGITHLYDLCEAVVKECMILCKTGVGNADYNTGRLHCLENIKQHFGVE